ncbi:unnamed protein product [Protopolystoma xenopodis]|uniref:Uncharacterized protein n=1 Tax=Protopolystoma xenopodis TaxID=117903 RepID=A0A448WW76_9PLAT|nr:unnamed protein product [Protopolystoma xenopodis]
MRSIVPTERLLSRAMQADGVSDVSAVSSGSFLFELLRWFKEEFFRWADNFICKECGVSYLFRFIFWGVYYSEKIMLYLI